jgi:hypothetical protein
MHALMDFICIMINVLNVINSVIIAMMEKIVCRVRWAILKYLYSMAILYIKMGFNIPNVRNVMTIVKYVYIIKIIVLVALMDMC